MKDIFDIKYKQGANHLGSVLTAYPIIKGIFEEMGPNDKFILSSGHAGLAQYFMLEKKGILTREEVEKMPLHPSRDESKEIWASTGSLGHGLPIALGMALA